MKSFSRYVMPFLCVVLGVLLILFPPKRIASLDDIADSYFTDSVTKASVAYGTTRLINAGVSVVKESTIQLEPGGVGMAVAVGQVADPLDDMTERLSSILVTAIVSLLVQKMSFEIAQTFVFQLIGILLIAIALLSIFRAGLVVQYRNLLVKVVLFLAVIRLFLPISALLSHHLNQELFFPRIEEHQLSMEPMIREFKNVTDFEIPEVRGIGDVFSAPVRLMGEKGNQFNAALKLLVNNGMEIFNDMIAISALYIGVFVIQVLFIPLLMFWLLNKLVFVIFSQNLPQVLAPAIPLRRSAQAQGEKDNG